MRERVCSHCGAPAAFSVALILSTLGCSPRLQKTSTGHRLCAACIEASICAPIVWAPFTGKEALSETYTQLASGFKERTNPQFSGEEQQRNAESTSSLRMSANSFANSAVKGGPEPQLGMRDLNAVDRETKRNKARELEAVSCRAV